jgi:hypothetical protein
VVVHDEGEKNEEQRSLDLGILKRMVCLLSEDTGSISLGIVCLLVALSDDVGCPTPMNFCYAMKYIYAMLDEMREDELETSTLGRPGGLNKAKAGEAENFNGRSALKDWAKALKLDPSLVVARLALVLWNAAAIQKKMANFPLSVYSLLAWCMKTTVNLICLWSLGSNNIPECSEFYGKSLQSTSRRVEVYGPRAEPNDFLKYLRNTPVRCEEDG